MKKQKCNECGQMLELGSFRFTRGYRKNICRGCETATSRNRYRKKRSLGLIRHRPASKKDIRAVIDKYQRIFCYLKSLGPDPVRILAGDADKVLDGSARNIAI